MQQSGVLHLSKPTHTRVGFRYLRERAMATLLITEEATVAEIDEALGHARRLPHDERGPAWFAFVDRLLEMRAEKS